MAIGPSGQFGSGQMNRNQTQPTPAALTGKYSDLYKRVKVTVEPSQEPVTLDQLKAHLRITGTDEDAYLTSLITIARQELEDYTRRKFITQTLQMSLDQWPFADFPAWEGVVEAPVTIIINDKALLLWFPPLQSVSSVTIYYRDDTSAVYPSSNYRVSTSTLDDYGRIVLKTDATTVSNIRQIDGVVIEYIAGYGDDPSDVPLAIQQAILMLAAWLYTNRGDCMGDQDIGYKRGQTPTDLSGAAGMLGSYRIERLQS